MNRKKIIHLEDHELFGNGLWQSCLNKLDFPVYHLQFTDAASCIQYVNNSLLLEAPIDLIITDFNHPGLTGYEFALAIRRLCLEASVHIPVLLLTMAGPDKEGIAKGLEEQIFDKYLCKSSTSEDLIAAIVELCQKA
jgi:response regulator RpfG family c-di-GMP phosphodiesterase